MTHVYDWGLRGPDCLAIKCPQCASEARFTVTIREDEKGNRLRDETGRCTCPSCGYAKSHQLMWPDDAYFCVDVDETNLWAWTRDHAIAIRDFVESNSRDVSAFPGFKLSLLHLPNELLQKSARQLVVKRINRMLDGK
ncbi:hypothetical protein FF011L_44710 [Roseimaritima multifibrata]|uniref:Uncharacterized protein n=1 Tax=Roseimaritima multifibrata TaxID=1930274 RepID=A0A517MLA9_9BACT|nr:hypothetical protein FF011L_44710 [Roseimaritima multifibrata]